MLVRDTDLFSSFTKDNSRLYSVGDDEENVMSDRHALGQRLSRDRLEGGAEQSDA